MENVLRRLAFRTKSKTGAAPDFDLERRLLREGFEFIAGLDEVGRGCLAGPVAAGAVVFRKRPGRKVRELVRDSKQLTPNQLAAAYQVIVDEADSYAVGWTSPAEIDRIGIGAAVRQAMRSALGKLDPAPDHLLIDAIRLPSVNLPQRSIVRGDSKSLSIAAAAIVAKVERDRLMGSLAEQYPEYGFASHKGYGTRLHTDAIARVGPSTLHRMTFRPVQAESHRVPPAISVVTGEWAESFAAATLQERGRTVIGRNFRSRFGEVDLITLDGDALAFVEVRARQPTGFGTPLETISRDKSRRLIAACHQFLQQTPNNWSDWRIDVAAVELDRWNRPAAVEFIESAIEE